MLLQTDVTVPVQDAGDALNATLAGIAAALPRVLAFLLIILAGWLIASLLAKGVSALLRAVRFNDLADRSGFAEFVRSMGVRTDSSGVIASVSKWFVRLIALVVAFDALGLPAVSDVLRQLLLWLPNLIVALVVLVVGGLAAKALGNLVRGATAEAGFTNPDLLATVARIGVVGFAIVVAVNQLGIATVLINTLLIGVVGALAIAAGLAFGLGGRDKASQLISRWGHTAEAAGPRLEAAAEALGRRGNVGAERPWVQRSGFDRRINHNTA